MPLKYEFFRIFVFEVCLRKRAVKLSVNLLLGCFRNPWANIEGAKTAGLSREKMGGGPTSLGGQLPMRREYGASEIQKLAQGIFDLHKLFYRTTPLFPLVSKTRVVYFFKPKHLCPRSPKLPLRK